MSWWGHQIDRLSHFRWDWVTGGRAGSGGHDTGSTPSPRTVECKLHHRKLHKKLLHQMQEVDVKRGKQAALEDQQVHVQRDLFFNSPRKIEVGTVQYRRLEGLQKVA